MHVMKGWRWSAALFAALAGCTSIARVPLDEAAELATMGRERPLNEPKNPIRGAPRVLVFALDGVGHDDLHRALREGRMPNLASLLGAPTPDRAGVFPHAYSVPDVLSVLPSSTTAAWVSIFTGEPPGRTGVPGNEWFVRETMQFWAPVPVSVRSRDHATRLLTDELLSDLVEVPTLFERLRLRAHVSLNPVFRGADLLTVPNLSALGDLVGDMALGLFDGGVGGSSDVHRETDETSVRSVIGAIRDHGVPDVQVVYFPGIDLSTHESEHPLERQQRYLAEVTDTAIAEVVRQYREQGAMEDTYVVIVSDHGHTPVLNDDRHALGMEGEGEPTSLLGAIGFRVRPFSLHTDEKDFQAVLAYHGATASVYLADRSTCPEDGEECEWSRPPRLEEEVLPVARAFFQASRSGALVPELEGTLDLVLAREPRPVDQDALPFQVFDGERLVPVAEYLRANPRPDLLRLEERLRGLAEGAHGHLAGDVYLLARSGLEHPIEERYHFAGPSYSDHGSASEQDSHIPLILAHPGKAGRELRRLVRPVLGSAPSQLHLVPLVESLLGHR